MNKGNIADYVNNPTRVTLSINKKVSGDLERIIDTFEANKKSKGTGLREYYFLMGDYTTNGLKVTKMVESVPTEQPESRNASSKQYARKHNGGRVTPHEKIIGLVKLDYRKGEVRIDIDYTLTRNYEEIALAIIRYNVDPRRPRPPLRRNPIRIPGQNPCKGYDTDIEKELKRINYGGMASPTQIPVDYKRC
jgi:hypothetical protein